MRALGTRCSRRLPPALAPVLPAWLWIQRSTSSPKGATFGRPSTPFLAEAGKDSRALVLCLRIMRIGTEGSPTARRREMQVLRFVGYPRTKLIDPAPA